MTKFEKLKKAISEVEKVVGLEFVDGEHYDVFGKPTLFEVDGELRMSAEDGKYFADYYGEFNGGGMYIHPEIEKVAEENGYYADWEDAGTVVFEKL